MNCGGVREVLGGYASVTVSKPLRIIQCGTGNVGKHALRAVIERPDMELVAVRVFGADKVGKDAGSLVGKSSTGIQCTDSFDAILATPADCVSYNALAETLPEGDGRAVDEICQLLASGKNVVSTAVSHHIYPPVAESVAVRKIEAACKAGQTTFFSAGVNPGFSFDLWPIAMSHLSRRVDLLICSEFCDMQAYTSASAMGFMGFGLAPEVRPRIEDAHATPYRSAYYASMLMLADAMRVDLDDATFRREVAVSDKQTVTPAGTYPPGSVVASRLIFTGFIGGQPRIEYRVIWRVNDDVAVGWGTGDGVWTIDVLGDPEMHCRLAVTTETDSGHAVSITTAMHPVNAIPAVVGAAPGMKSHLDLPLYAGGYFPVHSQFEQS